MKVNRKKALNDLTILKWKVEEKIRFVLSAICSDCDGYKEELMRLWLDIVKTMTLLDDVDEIELYEIKDLAKRIENWDIYLRENEYYEEN